MISAIVACDKNNGIGKNGDLLFAIPDDMDRFIDITKFKPIIMGRKTWNSIGNEPLPARTNIVITHNRLAILESVQRNLNELKKDEANEMNAFTQTVVTSMESVKAYLIDNITSHSKEEIVIIGGGEIYKELLPYCDTVYLTRYYAELESDTYFPTLDKDEWETIECSDYKQHENHRYKFFTYKRIKQDFEVKDDTIIWK